MRLQSCWSLETWRAALSDWRVSTCPFTTYWPGSASITTSLLWRGSTPVPPCTAGLSRVTTSVCWSKLLIRQCLSTLNVTSRRCLGMCWTRSSRPSLSADCVRQPQGAPDPPRHPPPPLLKHNIIMLWNTAAGTSSIALFISPEIRKISFPLPSSSVSNTLLFLCTLSSVITPWHYMLFYRLTLYLLRLLCNALSFLLPGFPKPQQPPHLWLCTELLLFLDALHPLLFPVYLSALHLSAIQSVTVI